MIFIPMVISHLIITMLLITIVINIIIQYWTWGKYTVITPFISFFTPKKSGFTIGCGAAI